MLTLDLKDFMLELKDGALKHVGPSTKSATVKLYDVEAVEVREFGDNRVKVAFEDGEGNEVETALFPEEASEIREEIAALEGTSEVFE